MQHKYYVTKVHSDKSRKTEANDFSSSLQQVGKYTIASKLNECSTNCTFSGLFILEPRAPAPLLAASEAEAIEKRLSSSEMSISGALQKINNVPLDVA